MIKKNRVYKSLFGEEFPRVRIDSHLFTANLIGNTLKQTKVHAINCLLDGVTELGVGGGVSNHRFD